MSAVLKRKINTLRILLKNGISKPQKMGDNILLLATAPCAEYFFKYESVREQFKDYDLAIINFMLVYSQKEVFELKPKYIVLFDPIFYMPGLKGDCIDFDAQKVTQEILERVNWDCYVVTTALADFDISNKCIQFIRLSFLSCEYKYILYPLFRRNWLNMGIYNVIQGALFFAITFGYKNIAMLGCPYKHLKFHMEPDGLHIEEHRHYYDEKTLQSVISNEELQKREPRFTLNLYTRAYKSSKTLWDIKNYAVKRGVSIINYSEDSEIDAFSVGELNIK